MCLYIVSYYERNSLKRLQENNQNRQESTQTTEDEIKMKDKEILQRLKIIEYRKNTNEMTKKKTSDLI